jgi:putative methyltransferase (TIGR04325 family)
LKKTIRKILSYFIQDKYTKYLYRYGSGWSGDYKSWQDAKKYCTGYDDTSITEKVLSSILETKDQAERYERDSSIIEGTPDFALNSLRWIKALAKNHKINLVDFGGSLGSSFFQLKPFFDDYSVSWNIVEQEHVSAIGESTLQDDELKFFSSIKNIPNITSISTFFSSCAIQYLQDPYKSLNDLNLAEFNYLIFDRLSVIERDKDLLTIQVVPKNRYEAIYPCWFLSKEIFLNYLSELGFSLIDSFSALGGNNATRSIPRSEYRAFILEKNM